MNTFSKAINNLEIYLFNRELYELEGIDLEDKTRINAFEFLRLLDEQYL